MRYATNASSATGGVIDRSESPEEVKELSPDSSALFHSRTTTTPTRRELSPSSLARGHSTREENYTIQNSLTLLTQQATQIRAVNAAMSKTLSLCFLSPNAPTCNRWTTIRRYCCCQESDNTRGAPSLNCLLHLIG